MFGRFWDFLSAGRAFLVGPGLPIMCPAISCFYVKRHWKYFVCAGGKPRIKFNFFNKKNIIIL